MMKKLIIGGSISFAIICSVLMAGYYVIFGANITSKDSGIIYVEKNSDIQSIVDTLQKKGYIKNEKSLLITAQLKKYTSNLKSGRYKLKGISSNAELIDLLRSGQQEAVNFTFNNIRTMEQFANMVSTQLDIEANTITKLSDSLEFVHQLGFTKETFIGMFIPNTYKIYWNTSATDFMKRMSSEYNKFWTARHEKIEKVGLTAMDVMILASIIEEETTNIDEYPIVAGVYMNRLNKNIPLAACPTLKFAWNDFTLRRILNKHLEIESPYNTYKYQGLPPGPVRMPSITVIDAVLNYQKHDYLFFCAKSDFSGRHHFSKTLREHNEYARQYHAELNKRKIY